MIDSNEQSKDSIKMKCDEIRELCDKFDKAAQKRDDDLKKAMDIHECLEMVTFFFEVFKSSLLKFKKIAEANLNHSKRI